MHAAPRQYVTEPGGLADIAVPAIFKPLLASPDAAPTHATGTERQVCLDIARRQAHGLAKYGVSVHDNPLQLLAWLQHAYEETLDNAVYLKRAMQQIERDLAITTTPPEDPTT